MFKKDTNEFYSISEAKRILERKVDEILLEFDTSYGTTFQITALTRSITIEETICSSNRIAGHIEADITVI